MEISTILPLEDLLGAGGWMLYIFATCFLLGVIAWIGYFTFGYWFSAGRLFLLSRQREGRGFHHGWWEKALGIGMAIVLAIFLWMFVKLIVFQLVQVVRFDDHELTLVYRWPWLDETIPYHSITKIEIVDTPPSLTLPWSHPRGGFPVTIKITTRDRVYSIYSGSTQLRPKAKAIYDEIQRHSAEFDRNYSSTDR
jgi:hypothetical protein